MEFLPAWTPNFPEHVSLLEDFRMLQTVAEQVCFSKTGSYRDPDFMAIGYPVYSVLRTHKEFINNDKVKQMNPDSYFSEILYGANIPKKFIVKPFAVRTYRI